MDLRPTHSLSTSLSPTLTSALARSYLMHHEELESLVKNYPTIKEARFWMTFGQQYLTYLDCIQNLGMSRIDEIEYEAPLG